MFVTKRRYRASCGSPQRRWRRCVCRPIARGLSSAAPAPARRRWGRLVGRWLGCPPLAGAVGGSRLSSQAQFFSTAVSLELGDRNRLLRGNRRSCATRDRAIARRRQPQPRWPTLWWVSHSRCPGEEPSLQWLCACACVVLSTHGQRRIGGFSRRKSRKCRPVSRALSAGRAGANEQSARAPWPVRT